MYADRVNAARAIKAVADTPLRAWRGSMCCAKLLKKMMNESKGRGERRMLVKQVRKGRITIEQAAEDANMSVEQFRKVMDDTLLQKV